MKIARVPTFITTVSRMELHEPSLPAALAWSPCSELASFHWTFVLPPHVRLSGFAPPGSLVGVPLRLSLIPLFSAMFMGVIVQPFMFPRTTPNKLSTTSQHSPRCQDPIAAMWLVNCFNYRLEPNDVDGPEPKPYWILSHTWGDDEVTFQDMQNLTLARQKRGF